MSTRIRARRLGQSALTFRPRSTYPITSIGPSRPFSLLPWKKKSPTGKKRGSKEDDIQDVPHANPKDPLANPLLDHYLAKNDPAKKLSRPEPRTGGLSQHESTLLKPEYEIPGWREGMLPAEVRALKEAEERRKKAIEMQREHDLHALRLDPAPRARRRFERKMVIRDVSRQQRVTKAIKLARTERQLLYRSQNLPTSTKKLTRIMRLIAGKTVEEALVQLRFSNKRIARDVLKGLQVARDEAIAKRGMGLGPSSSPITRRRQKLHLAKVAEIAANEAAAKAEKAGGDEEAVRKARLRAAKRAKREVLQAQEQNTDPYMADGSNVRSWPKEGRVIEMKDGSKKKIHDLTEMYVDQAWVGKGEEQKSPEFRARGRVNMLTHRSASFSVLLKEEKTRLRISYEIQKKRDNRKLWLPLPDRPVTSQRQYCLW